MQNTSYLQTQTIVKALEYGLSKGAFSGNPRQKKTASSLLKEMTGTKSVSGRHRQLVLMLKKGATLGQMIKASGSSRRTIFRYLNHFKDAGVTLSLSGGKYKLK